MDVAFPIARDQVAQVEAILTREGSPIHHDDAMDIYELTTFRPETVR